MRPVISSSTQATRISSFVSTPTRDMIVSLFLQEPKIILSGFGNSTKRANFNASLHAWQSSKDILRTSQGSALPQKVGNFSRQLVKTTPLKSGKYQI